MSRNSKLDENTEAFKELMGEALCYIEWLIERCKILPGGPKRKKQLEDIIVLIAKTTALEQERYIHAVAAARLANVTAIREALKNQKISKQGKEQPKKSAIQLADELINERYMDKSGQRTLVFQHDSWFDYDGAKYVERSKAEIETAIVAKIRDKVGSGTETDVSQRLVTSIRLATYPLIALPTHVEAPCWIDCQETTDCIISMQNGLINLRRIADGTAPPLMGHTPNFFTLSSLPYPYIASAKCSRWLQFLDDALSIDPDLLWLMQEFYGLCLTNDNRFHAFLFLQGESRTGKGVAFEVLQHLVGLENVSSVPLRDFSGNFGLEPMLGKKLNINAEVPELDSVAEDILKEFTGGGTMLTFHRKNKKSIITTQRPRLAFSSNHYPNFKDRSEGIWNRMIFIPFRNVVPEEERNPDLVSYLLENELPGIFNWAMEGVVRLVKNGGFTDSLVMRQEREEYREETVPTRLFFKAVVVQDTEGAVTITELYDLYKIWSKINGFRQQNISTFGRDAKAYLPYAFGAEYSKRAVGDRRGYLGIACNEEVRSEIMANISS